MFVSVKCPSLLAWLFLFFLWMTCPCKLSATTSRKYCKDLVIFVSVGFSCLLPTCQPFGQHFSRRRKAEGKLSVAAFEMLGWTFFCVLLGLLLPGCFSGGLKVDRLLTVCEEGVSWFFRGCLKSLCVFLDKQQAEAENQAASQDTKHIPGCGRVRSWQYLLGTESQSRKGLGDVG